MSLLIALSLAEWGARTFLPSPPPVPQDERNLAYRYDRELGWFPVEGGNGFFSGHRRVSIRNNSDGFRDHEYGPKVKPRIAVLGDSYVWGFDVEQDERFTEKLQARLPDWEVLNMGVSGYGTDQEYLLLKKFFSRLQPDMVFVFFCSGNDRFDNNLSIRYGGYYKPYFTRENGRLIQHGVPVPKSVNYYAVQYPLFFKSRLFRALFDLVDRAVSPAKVVQESDLSLPLIEEVKKFVEERGAQFMLALVHDDPKFEPELTQAAIPYISVRNDNRYSDFGEHWTPAGHDFVAERLLEAVRKQRR